LPCQPHFVSSHSAGHFNPRRSVANGGDSGASGSRHADSAQANHSQPNHDDILAEAVLTALQRVKSQNKEMGEHRLFGGTETTVDGRRGYRLRVTPDSPVPAEMWFADDVVADTELGILLRMIYHAGSKPVSRWELRDVVVGGDIHIDIPEEALAADDDDLANPARIAALFARYTARDVRSKLRNIFGDR